MIDEKERKNGMGPVHDVARQKEWVLMSEEECTKKCNPSEIDSENALPSQKKWARPDESSLASAGYGIFDDISELTVFVRSFERENAETIEKLTAYFEAKHTASELAILGGL